MGMVIREVCPRCQSATYQKNGHIRGLLGFIVTCFEFETLPDHLNVQPISCDNDVMIQRLEAGADEVASFIQKKANKQWIWLAMGAKTRQIIPSKMVQVYVAAAK